VVWNNFGDVVAPGVAVSFVANFGSQSSDLTGLV